MQNKIINTILILLSIITCISCKETIEDDATITRTVVVYMSAENNLGKGGYLNDDYNEIIKGAKSMPDNVRLLVYVDNSSSTNPPYIALIDKNKGEQIVKEYTSDFYSSNADNMHEILNWCYSNYPAQSYGLVLWGHGNGWIIEPESKTALARSNKAILHAYGAETGEDNTTGDNGEKWMNIPQMADALSNVPHLDFIFFDCCCMQCAEVAYELRNVTDYIIGSPAEIPGEGAPYNYVVPDFFMDKALVGEKIVNDYIEYGDFGRNSGLPLSVVKTDEMENLANATQQALSTFMSSYQYPTAIPLTDCIYYYSDKKLSAGYRINYDMRNFMRNYLSANDFQTWDNAFQKAVIYSRHPEDIHTTGLNDWMTDVDAINIDFSSFYLNDENYGGLSMFVPQTCYSSVSSSYLNPNTSIFLTEWSNIVNWTVWGW